jgi:hypothetical protein
VKATALSEKLADTVFMDKVGTAVSRFIDWLDRFGETSYDHQSFYASRLGRGAKALYYRRPLLGTIAVAPMVICEAFIPSARRLFWIPQRFPIADAHYAMGFAFLAGIRGSDKYYNRGVHFLEVLQLTRSRGYEDYCWGYPFNWETRTGTMAAGTPMITTVPYVYEAFSQIYAIDKNEKWLRIMRSIARHVFSAYRDIETGPDAASCSYIPSNVDRGGVINASAYRAFLLTKASIELSEPSYAEVARRNLNFVVESQNPDGSWYYSADGQRDFVDHFHTCFVMKALAKIEALTENPACTLAIKRGMEYYLSNLFDHSGLPKPFSRAPRLTVYRRELYDCAECINLALLMRGRFHELDDALSTVITELMDRWQKADGSFRARELLVGWDNVPMHRWAQSQLFRSLCFFLNQSKVNLKLSVSKLD